MSAMRWGIGPDATLLIGGQAVRAVGYGFTAVILGALLAARGYSNLRAGLVLTALIAGSAVASLLVGALADRVGRRRCYGLFFLALAVAGAVVAAGAPFWVLLLVAVTGTLSTDVVDNGPATTLEQVMLAAEDAGTAVVYGRYNAVGAAAGALGALAVVLPGVGQHGVGGGVHGWLFLVLVPVGLAGAVLAWQLSPAVEASDGQSRTTAQSGESARVRSRLGESRGVVRRLAGLFALDAAGGGLVTTGFLSYFFSERYGISIAALGWLFFTVTLVQAISVALAPRLARRFGLVATMVGTHLPTNVLLAAVAFAPTFPAAALLLLARTTLSQMDVPTRQALVMSVVTPAERTAAALLLLARTTLSQMDVPTRQALVMSVVTPAERTAAAAITNAARYTVRPIGPLVVGAAQQLALGAPLVLAGVVKGGYDLALWRWARHLPLARPGRDPESQGTAQVSDPATVPEVS